MAVGIYTELINDLPPFIVEISGQVEDYKWIGDPKVEISFPESVPDLGIKPLSFWEKYIKKPIETRVKEIEIIITKVTGFSFETKETVGVIKDTVVNIWNKIKSFVSDVSRFWGNSWS